MAKRSGAAHVVTIVKRVKDRVYRTHLLRRSYRKESLAYGRPVAASSAVAIRSIRCNGTACLRVVFRT